MMADELTWKDIVRDAIIELGGSAHLRQINEKIAGHPRTKTNPTWKDTIRRVVRQYSIFEPVPPHRSGIYRYVAPPPIPEPLPEPKPVEAADPHGEIQGMMLRLGHLYGYEVFAPSNDRTTRQFQGVPLSSLTTVSTDLREVSTRNHREIARIDVVWFGEDDDGIFPCYAYEVEHTTKVRDSLSRLLKIPARYP
ncbi:MAG: hypothetical protein FJ279_10215, partial [Planctomycetes bacterium]|nr:hypothetical protein [Planctomycetota bacterium]